MIEKRHVLMIESDEKNTCRWKFIGFHEKSANVTETNEL